MIPTTGDYKTAINGDGRIFRCKVAIFFDGDDRLPVEFTEESIAKMQTLEEVAGEGDSPLGLVSSGELTVEFDNSTRALTPTNKLGPYYGKLHPDTLVKAEIGIEVAPSIYEYVLLGSFRTGDWAAPSNDIVATVTCRDRLAGIRDKDIPMMPVQESVTIYEMFEVLFQALGMTTDEYDIDSNLRQKVALGWLPHGKVQAALQTLAVAGNCNVTVDRHDRIRVQGNFVPGDPAATLNEDKQLVQVNNPPRYRDIYSAVNVSYHLPVVQESSGVLKVDITIPHGGISLQDLEFSEPVHTVEQIRLLGAQNSRVSGLEYGAWGISLNITNSGADEEVALEVIGKAIKTTKTSCVVQDRYAATQVGERELSVDNHLIQDQVTARRYAASLLYLVKDPLSKYTAKIRGNPALEAGDIVELTSDTVKLGSVSVMVSRISMEFDGGLEADIDCTAQVVPVDWVFVSPGLSALMPRKI